MIKRLFLAIILLVVVGGSLILFNLVRDRMIAGFFANFPEQTLPVTTVTVEPAEWMPDLSAIGTVRAVQGVDLTVEGAGIVRSLDFAANDVVEKGQILLTLDDETQKADLEAARTQMALAETNLARARRLQERGVTADASLDTSEANARNAEAQVARAEAVLDTRVLDAPFAGVIGIPQIDAGSYVTPGTVVATLQDLSRMRVDFSLPEQDLKYVHMGQKIRLRIDGRESSEEFEGKIIGIDPRVEAASRMIKLRGELDNPEEALTPGQFVSVSVELPIEENVIALPQTAVMTSLYGDYVYIVRERKPTEDEQSTGTRQQGDLIDRLVAKLMAGGGDDAPAQAEDEDEAELEASQLFVTIGRRAGGLIEITSDNLEPGDQIISSGQNRLSHGQRVKIDNTVQPTGALQAENTPTDAEDATPDEGEETSSESPAAENEEATEQ